MHDDKTRKKQSLQEIIHTLSIKSGEYTDPSNDPSIEANTDILEMPLPEVALAPGINTNDPILDTEEDIEIGTVIPIDQMDLSRIYPEKLFGSHQPKANPPQPIFHK